MDVKTQKIALDAYKLFESVYREWKRNHSLSFQLPTPLEYRQSEELLETTWLEGKRASALYFLMPEELSGRIYGTTPSVYVKESAEFLAWLHGLEPSSRAPDLNALRERHARRIEEVVDRSLRERLIRREQAEEIREAMAALLKRQDWGPSSVVHGDFKTQNILIRKDGLSIIDFEWIRYDFSYVDLARFITNVRLRVSKYHVARESQTNRLASTFIGAYEKMRGRIGREALDACYLQGLIQELAVVLGSSPTEMTSLKQRIGGLFVRRSLACIVEEIGLLRR